MTVGATLVASLLATLERPATWPLALAGFLVRGGLLLVLLPIVVLPTAVGLANVLAPILTSAVLTGLTSSVLIVIAATALGGVAWLLGGGLLAAATEAEGVRLVVEGEGVSVPPRPDVAWRILAVRLAAYVPLILALIFGATRIVAAAYREFTVPVDTVTPLALRVIKAVPDALALVVLAWLFGEILGAVAARRVVIADDGTLRALRLGLAHVVRRPLRCVALAVVPLLALIAVLVPSAAAAAASWSAIRASLEDGSGTLLTLGAVVILVAVWTGQLVLLGMVAAWRAAVWTVDASGTFGGVLSPPEGDWRRAAASGSLGDPASAAARPGSEGDA